MPSSRRTQDRQSAGSSPCRGGSGRTGGRSGETRRPSASNGLTSQPVIRDSGSRCSASAAATAWRWNSSGDSGMPAPDANGGPRRRLDQIVDMRDVEPTSGSDGPRDHPTVLADLAVAGEPLLLVGRERPVEKEPGRHRGRVLRVALDPASAEAGDQGQRARQAGRGHTLTAVSLADVVARDPPVREVGEVLLVGHPVLDPGQLLGSAELAPADARVAVEHERRVRGAVEDPRPLAVPVLRGRVAAPSGWKPMHQQPPKMPLLASTRAANAGHVDSSSGLTS